jgi:hypothetical protein
MDKNLREYENSNYFSLMKRTLALFILLFITSFTQLNAQAIKRKYRGVYLGAIPPYEMKMGQDTLVVSASRIEIFLDRDSLYLEIGKYRYAATYQQEKLEDQIVLTFDRENSGIREQLMLNPKNKTMTRKGLYPQPDAVLVRKGKLPRR